MSVVGIMAQPAIWKEIEIEHEGRKIAGSYEVSNGMITIMSEFGRKTARLGGIFHFPEGLARKMLRDLAKEGKA